MCAQRLLSVVAARARHGLARPVVAGMQRAQLAAMTHFPGATSEYTEELKLRVTTEEKPMACFRVMDQDGQILNKDIFPKEVTDEKLLQWYRTMALLNQMDTLLYNAQRQGRISFYMTNYGEEATHLGACAKGYMPVHYGSHKLNFHTISSPLGTQIPQASGAAYALKAKGKENCVICYFGEGAASEGDAHAGFNFAATLDCPVIFFCRNNGYAISTPTHDQYRGDGIVSRAAGYGMDCIRVDGNDVFAVYLATKAAREATIANKRPVLVEAMTYRIGHHSTSDDSTTYRGAEEVSSFQQDTPIERLQKYLRNQNLWDDDKEKALQEEIYKEVRQAFAAAEKKKKPSLSHMFEDVYDVKPARLVEQEKEMLEHIKKYPNEYPTKEHAQ
ncbi:hypothetical protein PTSG_11771 [Salpingoeca rosetta]|uniref:2-oxoisovalerate dehydrogenase subunit alpha n=1 Tax=Salpingoeca rosetta (strain ATCC 50818 / BSB-021) TaxID=946362 RepID=F2TYP9_SALR5|nr:uncharacterized protein PTSG_11771 [Salpingoeca rosetta]EGD78723.1 hypothetical protein PTSG_11771 [Salpingoeca rosetta]|eukprot:XP_004997680.1 hypothetical protein PTSG_11771 [Salpingoeca rosetta]